MVLLHLVAAVAAFLGTIIKRWHHKQMTHFFLKSPRVCTMLGSSMRRVGLIDITVGDAPRRIATFRDAARRNTIATQRLSRWGSPAAQARLARTVPSSACGLRDAYRSQPDAETEEI
jgi:hypothetical protein